MIPKWPLTNWGCNPNPQLCWYKSQDMSCAGLRVSLLHHFQGEGFRPVHSSLPAFPHYMWIQVGYAGVNWAGLCHGLNHYYYLKLLLFDHLTSLLLNIETLRTVAVKKQSSLPTKRPHNLKRNTKSRHQHMPLEGTPCCSYHHFFLVKYKGHQFKRCLFPSSLAVAV